MQAVVGSLIPFPNILWWYQIMDAGSIIWDLAEHFQKMTYRNRYYISGSNGLIQLSIPLVKGRDQRTVMKDVLICNKDRWQVQHWRTITSVYKRSPYFDHYEPSLYQLFEDRFEKLSDFNLASVHWLKRQLKLPFEETITDVFNKTYPEDVFDLRNKLKPGIERQPLSGIAYYQVFAERTGFLPNLSMLDLLFSEGPHSLQWIKHNGDTIENWQKKD